MSVTIHQIGDKIHALGLTVPAILLLESLKPLSGLVRHAGQVSQDVVPSVPSIFSSLMELFSDRNSMEALIVYLEEQQRR